MLAYARRIHKEVMFRILHPLVIKHFLLLRVVTRSVLSSNLITVSKALVRRLDICCRRQTQDSPVVCTKPWLSICTWTK